MKIEQKVIESLIDRKKTLALAESCTGGLLGSRLTDISGSSQALKGGIIAYSNEIKVNILKIKPSTLKKYGAVSSETASNMAKNVRNIFNTTFGIGISGIAGPAGGTKLKPIGLVFIAISTPHNTICIKNHFTGTRTQNKKQAATQALKLLQEHF